MKNILKILSIILLFSCYGNLKLSGNDFAEGSDSLFSVMKSGKPLVASQANGLYTVTVVQHDSLLFQRCFNGETPQMRHDMQSVSKTLVSMAAGLAYDEGKLDMEARVVDFFPDKVPADLPDSMRNMTIHNLMTMQTGFVESATLMSIFSPNTPDKDSIDWLSEFFSSPHPYRPGSYFYYNLFGTYVMCAILQRITGQDLVEYITPRLLEPLGIEPMQWARSPQGICTGGWGARICAEDMVKFGKLLLHRGKWEGRQLISEEWMDKMTSHLVDSAPHIIFNEGKDPALFDYPTEHHSQGYGYYLWLNPYGCYRAEGLGGQYIHVFPQQDAVLVITANTTLEKEIFDVIWKYFLPRLQLDRL